MTDRLGALLTGRPYRLIRPLGHGGMGKVFVIENRHLRRRFVLKLPHARLTSNPQFLDRMRIEAQATGRLQHPNIVDVVDFWVDGEGQPCIVMEYLEGKTLAHELAARAPFAPVEAVEYAWQLASALAAAHALGIVHRDIKPENLFLAELPGAPRTLKVLDFGLARVFAGRSERTPSPLSVPTETGTVVGSPRFMSPEARRGERVDHRGDICSAGLVLYAMLAGVGPFDRVRAGEALSWQPAPPSDHVGPGVPPALDALVLKTISEGPSERYQTASDLADALANFRVQPKRW